MNSQSMAISVIVPVIERVDDIHSLHTAICEELRGWDQRWEIIYLANPFFETEIQQLREFEKSENEDIHVVVFERPVDESSALTTALDHAKGEVFITIPSYFELELQVLQSLAESVEEGADLAIATRSTRTEGWFKKIQSQIFNRLVTLATRTQFSDLASATRAIRREVLEEVPVYGDFHRFLPVLAERVGFRTVEITGDPSPKAAGPLLYSPRTYLWRALDILSVFFLARFTRRPLRLFGGLGASFGVSGAVILLLLGGQRLLGTPLADRPLLLLGVLLLGLGVQAITIGLLGELLLFFHASELREYRIGRIDQGSTGRLKESSSAESPG